MLDGVIANEMCEQLVTDTLCTGDAASEVHGYFADGIFEGSIKYEGVEFGIEVSTL